MVRNRYLQNASDMELTKTYADGSTITKTYDVFGRLATETNARGMVKTLAYDEHTGQLIGIGFSDVDTPGQDFEYNVQGQMTQVTDAAGTRTLSYNEYGELATDSLVAGGKTHLITENRDVCGRSSGYTYAKAGSTQQTVSYAYGEDGRMASASFRFGNVDKLFSYGYLAGSNLLQTLTMPNGMTLTQEFETQRDLLTAMFYKRGTTGVSERHYTYDSLGRPLTRSESRKGTTRNDAFTHNDRSELTAATLGSAEYSYAYDNIGNRKSAQENAEEATAYAANNLNQYTAVGEFAPEFDADGNQTRVQTSTGIWNVTYNTENRPTVFNRENANGSITRVTCAYDYMGRRATKKVETITTNAETEESTASTTLNQRYLYRGYLQVACCDLTRSAHPCLWLITWEPTQPVATRPLAIQKDATWYAYGWDLTKNICEAFGSDGYIKTVYSYTPYGAVTASGTVTQPIQWSSEFYDDEQGLVYYNYRHYNPADGRWIERDPLKDVSILNLYDSFAAMPTKIFDIKGLYVVLCFAYKEGVIIGKATQNNKQIEIKNVFSGKGKHENNANSQHVKDEGPIPEGEYWIGGQYTPKRHQEHANEGDYNWFRLYGNNGEGGKSYEKVVVKDPNTNKNVTRGAFNLHAGCFSEGCITVKSTTWPIATWWGSSYPQSADYKKLRDYINGGNKRPFRNPRKTTDTYPGIMYVRKCLAECRKVIK